MTSYERMIRELAGAAGAEIKIGSDRVCEMAIGEVIVLLKPADANEEAVTLFAVVSDGDTGEATLKKALRLNLFGSGTLGAHLGLFASALILSRDLPLAELAAEDLAEQLLAFARQAEEIARGTGGRRGGIRGIRNPHAVRPGFPQSLKRDLMRERLFGKNGTPNGCFFFDRPELFASVERRQVLPECV